MSRAGNHEAHHRGGRASPAGWPAAAASAFERLTGGLRLVPRAWPEAVPAMLATMLGATGLVLLVDGVLFRDWLPQSYVDHYTGPLHPRTLLACSGSAREEAERLVIMALVMAGLTRTGQVRPWLAGLTAIVAGQMFLVWPLILAFPLYATLRFWVVGSLWGWLCWRQGWAAALLAHGTVHLMLDPLLLMILSA